MFSHWFPAAWLACCGMVCLPSVQAQPPSSPYSQIVSQAPPVSVDVSLNPFAIQVPGPGDYLRGLGDYFKKKEEAALLKEDVRRAKLETRRQELEHWEWERAFTAGLVNRQRQRQRREEIIRTMNKPPLTEIVSGYSLNVILKALKEKKEQLAALSAEPLQAETVEAINTNFGAGGHVGLLRNGKIAWPAPLKNPIYAATCQRIEACVARIYQQLLATSEVAYEDLRELGELAAQLEARLREQIRKAPDASYLFLEFTTIRGFSRQLDGAVSLLIRDQKNAVLYLRPVEGRNAVEIARYLINNGLEIAPPTQGAGGERHYRILHGEFVRLLKQVDPNAGVVPPPPG